MKDMMSSHRPHADTLRIDDLSGQRINWETLATFDELLRQAAECTPDRTAFRFSEKLEGSARTITYRDLDLGARRIAKVLQDRYLDNQRALLVFPPGLEFIVAFFGCLYAGTMAVPTYPFSSARTAERFKSISRDAGIAGIIGNAVSLERLRKHSGQVANHLEVAELAYEGMLQEDPDRYRERSGTREDIAFLQYTSGSTGEPKGVMVSHGNLLHNSHLISLASGSGAMRGVSWLPHYHDMGLVGCILQTVYAEGALHLMPPNAFVARPLRWLQAISDSQATLTSAPNFAYQLCVDMIDPKDRDRLDLSSLRLAFNGAEPVRADTIRQFCDYFEPCGFRAEAMAPCYGMAETTLIVTASSPAEQPQVRVFDSRAITQQRLESAADDRAPACAVVGCGKILPDMDVRIVDPETKKPRAEAEIGEIWVSGPSVTKGYWGRPTETAAIFANRLPGSESTYLRTRDIGFLLAEELFVLGRSDSAIIVRGRNLYPQDIEASVEKSDPAIDFPGAVAFGIEIDGEQRVAVVAEIRRSHLRALDFDAVCEAVRRSVFESHDVQIYTLSLAPTGAIFRTTSGKVRREVCRQAYLNGSLHTIHVDVCDDEPISLYGLPLPDGASADAPRTSSEMADYIRRTLAAGLKLGIEALTSETELSTLGMDSITRIQVVTELSENLGVDIALSELVECRTLGSLIEKFSELSIRREHVVDSQRPGVTAVLEPDRANDPFPLTSVQEAYWMGRQGAFEIGNVSTHGYVEIDAVNLDLTRLTEAWESVVRRHGMLRTVILGDGRQQTLAEAPAYAIEVARLDGLSQDERQVRLTQIRDEMSHQVLPCHIWPLFDIRVSDLGTTQRLHLSIDLLIADLGSLMMVMQQWKAIYDGRYIDPPPTITFRDYVLAEKKFEQTAPFQDAQRYWLDRLHQLPPAPNLPLAKAPRDVAQGQFVRRAFKLERERSQTLKKHASQSGLTVTVALIAAFSEVLARWSASTQFTLNLTCIRRLPVHPEVDRLVGDFTSIMPLHVDATPRASFKERAAVIQRQLWADLDRRWADGIEILRHLRRVAGQSLGFPVVFTSGADLKAAGYDASSFTAFGDIVYSVSQTPQVWLDHQVIEIGDALYLSWDAVDELFPHRLIDDMFCAYRTLVKRLADSAAPWDAGFQNLIPDYQLKLRREANATAQAYPRRLLFEGIYEQVRRDPDALAVISSERTITYRELWGTAQQIADELRQQGSAKPECLIAVVMAKGWEQIPAVLAVQLAGSAYLPVDPDLPEQRRNLLLESGRVSCVLTQSRMIDRLAFPGGTRRICVDRYLARPGEIAFCPASILRPEDLAYVIYTSGSTGIPKGVMIDHLSAMNTIEDINERFGVGPRDRVLALSALNFDLSVYDIFGLLSAGGALVLPEHERAKDPQHWLDLMAEHDVTIWNTVPALLQMAVTYAAGHNRRFSNALRLAMISGDWIPTDLPSRLREVAELSGPVISLGGATEASIWSIWHPITSQDAERCSIPYGKPLRNQTFHVLDDFMQDMPVWVPGELYIGGAGLARGYWQDPEKTASKFVMHLNTNERVYKTGDIGRYLPDGSIEFLGRRDSQVKIDGYRIELGEIETVLRRHGDVQDVAVVVRDDTKGRRSIVAYVVPSSLGVAPASDIEPEVEAGMLTDPAERLAFKLTRPGLRQFGKQVSAIDLDPSMLTTEEKRVAYIRRQSYRAFERQNLPRNDFSRMMACLQPLQADGLLLPRFQYPSAGSLYPVQTYVYVKADRISGVPAGLYYYHPDTHRLMLLRAGEVVDRRVFGGYGGGNLLIFDSSGFALFLIARRSAMRPLYGSWSRDFCLLEAGYMGQLIMMQAPGFGIGLCPIGALSFDEIREAFQIEKDDELIHCFLGGRITEEQQLQIAPTKIGATGESVGARLQRYAAEHLPAYMVPHAFVTLEELPLSPNGKLDRNALPDPLQIPWHGAGGTDKMLPQNELEQALAAIVCDVLAIEEPDTHTSFFELGGSSIDLIHIQTRISRMIGREIPVVELFRRQTISALAAYLAEHDAQTETIDDIRERAQARRAVSRRVPRRKQQNDT